MKNIYQFLFVVLLTVIIDACVNNNSGKIPITTNSETALQEFLNGRQISDHLRHQESQQHFEKAVKEDPDFALAYLYSAMAKSTTQEFFEKYKKAVALVDKVSEGERLLILGFQAGVNGDPMLQRDYFKKLVAAYPNDERAHAFLGNNYYELQEYEQAIIEYKKAIAIDSTYSPMYNILGYAYRFLEQYDQAEKYLKKYIELIPDDPNPYDSYAELLMKEGKYEESILQYKEALSHNPRFIPSYIGIATNLNYLERHKDARHQCKIMYDIARNDGEKRAAIYTMVVSLVDEGKMEEAVEKAEELFEFDKARNDLASMASDLATKATILYEMGKVDLAFNEVNESLKIILKSDLPDEIKNIEKINHLFREALVAMKKKDFAKANAKAMEYMKNVESKKNENRIRFAHEIFGRIALEQNDFEIAIRELKQANQQNPYNLYRLGLAYKGLNQPEKAKEYLKKCVNFNALNSLSYAFCRNKAKALLNTF